MRKYILGTAFIFVVSLALTFISWRPDPIANRIQSVNDMPNDSSSPDSIFSSYVQNVYETARLAGSGLNFNVFEKAVTGFYNLQAAGKVSSDKTVLTIADFDLKSTKKRLWIIDLKKKLLVLNTWVAHGQGSGADKAIKFSNTNDSFQSSLGFYITGETYYGQHGRSLRLDGMDEGFNSNARMRSIVVHGANYVSQSTIKALGRLGRSQGCPAVAPEIADNVINAIQGNTVFFINSSDESYRSRFLNAHQAAMIASQSVRSLSAAADSLLSI